jgi:hypothetical protein
MNFLLDVNIVLDIIFAQRVALFPRSRQIYLYLKDHHIPTYLSVSSLHNIEYLIKQYLKESNSYTKNLLKSVMENLIKEFHIAKVGAYRTHLTSLNQCANSVIHRNRRDLKMP